ncbi:hypothetical protein LV84_01740 [Algoriphagus ratkowskyi]|uniref:Uncharacterized protein n=1 Tax=Algoriphagus ratkowskyi TaxID=57028 RepID=A0A2W7T333_9BACT|nr:hypothetical protein [Algoriphagus ratkowskyi]PZX57612.1 hypothetical protein LV84_01740 [Algoriphagus ratkowskyi]TXD78886.1 hypothetical protein ESW18_05035 [Algoriphagus ratkowskyi]
MTLRKIDDRKREERIDPDANPLTSFGREDDFTEDLINGVCEKNDTIVETSKESDRQLDHVKSKKGMDEDSTIRKQRKTRKKRRGIS